MKETLHRLIRLQELEFALTEQEAVGDEEGALALREQIDRSLEELPGSATALYRSLRMRSLAAVVPVRNGACSGCGFSLPTAQVGAITSSAELQQCRNCRRILYVRRESPDRGSSGPIPRSVLEGPARFSSADLMLPDLASPSADGALAEIVGRLVETGIAQDAERLLSLALDRERVASTALREGFAFPHVRGVEGGGMTFALGMRRDGMKFGARRRVAVVVFTIIPAAASDLYLTLVRDLLLFLRDDPTRSRLLACTTAAGMWHLLRSSKTQAAARGGQSTSSRTKDAR
jgi:mannitol/fructose-specific phosphotransferase system IIA component (Ntr-type)